MPCLARLNAKEQGDWSSQMLLYRFSSQNQRFHTDRWIDGSHGLVGLPSCWLRHCRDAFSGVPMLGLGVPHAAGQGRTNTRSRAAFIVGRLGKRLNAEKILQYH
jgi:hypothetical protein